MDLHEGFKKMEDYWVFPVKDACVSVSVELQLFDRLHEENHTIESLALRLNVNLPVLRALVHALRGLRFLESDEKALALAPVASQFLVSSSPFDRGDGFLGSRASYSHDRLKLALLEGWGPLDHDGKAYTQMWQDGDITAEAAENFTFAMQRSIQYPADHNARAEVFSSVQHLVDLGGGSGAWAKALTEHHPKIRVSIFDLPPVLETAKVILNDLKVPQERIELFPGNFFKGEIPSADAYLFSNILHDWSFEDCATLLKRVAGAAKSGSKLFIHECVLNENRMEPEFTSIFNLMMAINHRSQQFTFKELQALVEGAGFKNLKQVSEVAHYQLLVCERV